MGTVRRHNVVLGALAWLVIVSACQVPPGSPSTPVALATSRSAEATSTPEPAPTHDEPTLTPTSTPTSTPVASATPDDFDVITLENIEHVQALGRPVTSLWKIAQLVFRPDATWVAEPLEEGGIELRDFHTGEMVKSLAEAGTDIELIVVSPDGRRLASVSPTKEKISVWDLDNFIHMGTFAFRGYHSRRFVGGTEPLVGSFSRDNRYLAVAGCLQVKIDRNAVCRNAGAVVYDLITNEISTELAGYQHQTTRVAFSPDGELLALAGYGKSTPQADLLVWDVHQNRPLATLPSGYELGLSDIDFSCTGVQLASTTNGGELIIWDTSTWQAENPIKGYGPGNVRYSSADCSLLVTADGLHLDGLTFWDARTRQPIVTRETAIGILYRLAVSPDGRRVYTWGDDLSGFYRIQEWGIP